MELWSRDEHEWQYRRPKDRRPGLLQWISGLTHRGQWILLEEGDQQRKSTAISATQSEAAEVLLENAPATSTSLDFPA